MNSFIDAYDKLFEGLTSVLEELVDDGDIKNLQVMSVSTGTPEFPFLEIVFTDLFEVITDTGLSETFEGELVLSSQVLNNNDPHEGLHEATRIVSKAENLIVNSRRLKELGVFYIATKDFGWVPYAFGKQKNIYSAGVTFKIRFKLKNPKCGE